MRKRLGTYGAIGFTPFVGQQSNQISIESLTGKDCARDQPEKPGNTLGDSPFGENPNKSHPEFKRRAGLNRLLSMWGFERVIDEGGFAAARALDLSPARRFCWLHRHP
jgi:hypothetical protein